MLRVLALLGLLLPAPVLASTVVDQGSLIPAPGTSGSGVRVGAVDFQGFPDNESVLQTFTVGITGTFAGLRFQVGQREDPSFAMNVSIVEITGVNTIGATLGSTSVDATDVGAGTLLAPTTLELLFGGFAVTSGDSLGIFFTPDVPNPDGAYDLIRSIDGVENVYAGGGLTFFSDGNVQGPFAEDIAFQTLVTPAAIPLPPAAPLLLGAVFGLGLMRRSRRA